MIRVKIEALEYDQTFDSVKEAIWSLDLETRVSRENMLETRLFAEARDRVLRDAVSVETSDSAPPSLTFRELSLANWNRAVLFGHVADLTDWDASEWFTAVVEEIGEVASVLRSMIKRKLGLPDKQDKQQISDEQLLSCLADELADCVITIDLLASRMKIDLGQAVARKFNKTSTRHSMNISLGKRIELMPWQADCLNQLYGMNGPAVETTAVPRAAVPISDRS